MTSNQLRAAEIKENIRHNLAMEQENERSNVARESIQTRQNELTEMRNINDYRIAAGNLEKELSKLDEEIRHNMKGEALTKASNAINQLKATIEAAYVPLKQRELDIKQGELDLSKGKFKWQKLTDLPEVFGDVMEDLKTLTKGLDIGTEMTKRLKNILSLLDPISNLIDSIIPE